MAIDLEQMPELTERHYANGRASQPRRNDFSINDHYGAAFPFLTLSDYSHPLENSVKLSRNPI
jgi:hypothetical protein